MKKLAAVLVVALLPACGGGSDSPAAPPAPPPTTLPAQANITVTFNPDPVVATPSDDPALPFHATYTMVISETAGLAGQVNFWNETLFNPTTELQSPTRNFGATAVKEAAGTNQLAARGSLTITRSFNYTPGGGTGTGRAIDVRVVVQVKDDKGTVHNVEGVARII